MNKAMASLIVIGIGATTYSWAKRNNNVTKRMNKSMKKMTKAIF